jgi:hypothetical protein
LFLQDLSDIVPVNYRDARPARQLRCQVVRDPLLLVVELVAISHQDGNTLARLGVNHAANKSLEQQEALNESHSSP